MTITKVPGLIHAPLTLVGPDGDGVVLKGMSGNDIIHGGIGDQLLYGNAGDDILVANTGNSQLFGGSGNDLLIAGAGNQTIDGGSGIDTADFSHVSGFVSFDIGAHSAIASDPATGATTHTYSLIGIEKIIGSSDGNYFDTSEKAGLSFVGGNGNDLFHSEGGDQVYTGGGGHDTFEFQKLFAGPSLHAAEITDFTVGQDTIDMSDFLKGQGIKGAQYADVVHLHDTAQGTVVQGLIAGQFHDVALLDHVHTASLHDIGLG